MHDWQAYAKAIGGVTPLTAEIFCFAIWMLGQSLGCKLRFEEIYLPEVGREKTADEIGETLQKWVRMGLPRKAVDGNDNSRSGDQD